MKTIHKVEKHSVSLVCECFGLKRDAYYKYRNRSNKRIKKHEKVLALVKEERKDQSRVGTRKLYKTLKPKFITLEIKLGRDSLFDILREENLLIRRKRSSCRTTNSYHRFHKYSNLIKDMQIDAPNQVWVSDITYIKTIKGFCYLALITDLYSRKIVGFDISNSLELTGCLRALKTALGRAKPTTGLVHHSDRGIQYCSNQYTEILLKRGVKISMTEENHCYENAVAERVNGILKDEFYLDQCFTDIEKAKIATKNAVKIYNSKRLHLSLDYKTPNMVFEKFSKN